MLVELESWDIDLLKSMTKDAIIEIESGITEVGPNKEAFLAILSDLEAKLQPASISSGF